MSNTYIEHLYFHWPFCKNKCHYCDFVALEGHFAYENEYHHALCKEIKNFASTHKEITLPIKSLYLGGGTPSLYPLHALEEMSQLVRTHFAVEQEAEWTIEVNPGGITPQHMKVWRSIGCNRISIGVQVLDEKVLESLNRPQKNSETHDTVHLAAEFFPAVSVDLIIGLPGVTRKSFEATLEAMTNWPITHVSLYFMTLHENTPLFYKIYKGKASLFSDEEIIDRYEMACAWAQDRGMHQYEISNHALPGHESFHNKAYWQRKGYKGFGIGAASLINEKRTVNTKNLSHYLDHWNTQNNSSPLYSFEETLSEKEQWAEQIMLGLRTNKGISKELLFKKADDIKICELENKLKVLEEKKLITQDEFSVLLTPQGVAVSNYVIVQLL